MNWLFVVLYIVLAPFLGAILAGIDRKVSARLQGRQGPPILQPFYDTAKLMGKETASINSVQNFFVMIFFAFIIFTGALFFSGGDLLLVIFALTLSGIFLVLGAYSTNSPYSHMGAERELLQMMSYEPMVLLTAVGFYMVTKTFAVKDMLSLNLPPIVYLPGVFVGFVFILTIKLRKSPFDLSTSHHAHQELVKGVTTEFAGMTLAFVEIAHWFENVFLLGIVYLFFAWSSPISPIIGILACIVVFFAEMFIDNTNARFKWQLTLGSAWIVTLALGFLNLVILSFIW